MNREVELCEQRGGGGGGCVCVCVCCVNRKVVLCEHGGDDV